MSGIWKKLLSLMLVFMMVVGMFPVSVFADDGTGSDGEDILGTVTDLVNNEEEAPVEEAPVEEAPAEEAPAEEETPAEEEAPVEEETPAEEEAPAEEETPAEEEAPVEETPAEEAPAEEAPAEEEIDEAVAEVQVMIDTLPIFVGNEEEALLLEELILDVDDAMDELYTEQLEQLDFTNYFAALEALQEAYGVDWSQAKLTSSWESDNTYLDILNGTMSAGEFYTKLITLFGSEPSSGSTTIMGYTTTWGGDFRYDTEDHSYFTGWQREKEVSSDSDVTPSRGAAYVVRRTGNTSYSDTINFTVRYYYEPTVTVSGADVTGGVTASDTTADRIYHGDNNAVVTVPHKDGYTVAATYNGGSVTMTNDGVNWTGVFTAVDSSAVTVTYTEVSTTGTVNLSVTGEGTVTFNDTAQDAGELTLVAGEYSVVVTPEEDYYVSSFSLSSEYSDDRTMSGSLNVAAQGVYSVNVVFTKQVATTKETRTVAWNGGQDLGGYSNPAALEKAVIDAVVGDDSVPGAETIKGNYTVTFLSYSSSISGEHWVSLDSYYDGLVDGHYFGDNETESIKIVFNGDTIYDGVAITSDVTLVESREEATVSYNAGPMDVPVNGYYGPDTDGLEATIYNAIVNSSNHDGDWTLTVEDTGILSGWVELDSYQLNTTNFAPNQTKNIRISWAGTSTYAEKTINAQIKLVESRKGLVIAYTGEEEYQMDAAPADWAAWATNLISVKDEDGTAVASDYVTVSVNSGDVEFPAEKGSATYTISVSVANNPVTAASTETYTKEVTITNPTYKSTVTLSRDDHSTVGIYTDPVCDADAETKVETLTGLDADTYYIMVTTDAGYSIDTVKVGEDYAVLCKDEEAILIASGTVYELTVEDGATEGNTYAVSVTSKANTDTRYTVNIYTMDVNGQYGEPVVESLNGTTDTLATYEPEAKTGFTVADTSVLSGNIAGNGSLVLNVYYARDQHTVTWNAGEGTFENGDNTIVETYYYGAAVTAPANPTREAYDFGGWGTVAETMGTENVEYTAAWTVGQRSITWNGNGNSVTENYDYNSEVTAAPAGVNTAKEGYTFSGWLLNGEAVTFPYTVTAENVTFTAQWTVNQYPVIWNANGGTFADGDAAKTVSADYGSKIEKYDSEPTREGYTFAGWTGYAESDTVPVDGVTYYAAWDANEYTIKFMDGETELAGLAITADYASAITAPVTAKENYKFVGWSDVEGGTEAVDFPATMPLNGGIYYAIWVNDINNNDVDDAEETVAITTSVTGNGTVSVSGAVATEAGYVYDSKVEGGDVITVTATPEDTDATDGDVDVVSSITVNGETIDGTTFTVFDGGEYAVVANFVRHTLAATDGTMYLNGYYEGLLQISAADMKAEALRAVGLSAENADNYTVEFNVRGTFYDVEGQTLLSSNVSIIMLAVEVGEDGRQVRITDENTGVSKTVSVKILESRAELAITTKDVEISAKAEDELAISVADQVKAAVSIKATDPETGDVTTVAVSDSYLTYSYTWPADGETAEFTVTVQVNAYANETYSNNPSATLTLTITDTTVFYTVTYVDGYNEEGSNVVAEYIIAENGVTTVPENNPTREGYSFAGWEPAVAETVTGDVTYTATWTKDRNGNGIEDGTEDDPFYYYNWVVDGETKKTMDRLAGETEITSADYTADAKEGYVFVKWDETVSEDGYTTTYTAVWADDINGNGVADTQETITVTQVGEGTVSVAGATKITDTDNWVYDSTKVTSLTVAAVPVTGLDGLTVITKTYVASITENGEPLALTYNAAYTATATVDATAGETRAIVVTFEDAGFVLDEEGTMRFYTGIELPDYETLYNAVIDAPAYDKAAVTTVNYLARESGSYEVDLTAIRTALSELQYVGSLAVAAFDLAFPNGTTTVTLGEKWLDVGTELQEGDIQDVIDKAIADIRALAEEGNYTEAISALRNLGSIIAEEAGTIGCHAFGANTVTDGDGNVQEKLYIVYKTNARNTEDDTIVVTLIDDRAESFINGNDVSVMYKDYTAESLLNTIAAEVVDENGAAVDGEAKLVTTNVETLAVGEYEITLKFAGSYTHKPSTGTVTVTVTKAPAEIDLPNVVTTYGEDYSAAPTVTLGNAYGEETDITDSMIQFIVGLDVAELDINEDGITGLNTKIQLLLPNELQEMLDALASLTGIDLSSGMEMSLSDLQSYLEYIVDDSVTMLKQALEAISSITEAGDITITLGGSYPTDIGVYLYGAVSTNSNYETAFDAGYILIQPKTEQVYLDWNYNDTNGIFTWELLEHIDLGASAYNDEAFTALNETATQKVQYVLFGVDEEGNVTAELDPNEDMIGNGAYAQIAFIAEFGNEMNYAIPIVRAFVIVPNVVDVELLLTEDGEAQDAYTVEFNGHEQGLLVSVDGEIVDNAVTYTGIQTNTKTYSDTAAPVHAGAYNAFTYCIAYNDEGDITALGFDTAMLVIEPTTSTVEVESQVVTVQEGISHDLHGMVDAQSAAEGVIPDTTVITAQISSTGEFSENGWDAIQGIVNVDFPRWMDELIAEYAPSVVDGITLAELREKLVNKLPDLAAELEELGAGDEVINSVTDLVNSVADALENLPADAVLSFQDDITATNVGVYVIVGIVTDSDHYPSADADILVITPDVSSVYLKWNNEDANYLWTSANVLDMYASAYNDAEYTDKNEEATEKITYQFITMDEEGNLVILNSADELGNGVYMEIAYIQLEVDGQMYIGDMIARPLIRVPNVADVIFVDETGAENNDRIFTFDNEGKTMDVQVTVADEVITPEEGDVTYRYVGVQTNTAAYDSTVAPKHAGAYVVTATYTDYDDNGELFAAGMAVGAMVIKPADSTISVTGETVTYDGAPHKAEIVAASATSGVTPDTTVITGMVDVSGDISEIGLDAITANVNVDFPKWLDEILAETEAFNEGVTPAYLVDFLSSYIDDVFALIPVEELVAMGVITQDEIDAYIDQAMTVYDEIINVLGQLPEGISLTFYDNVTFAKPGAYLYYGIVTDSDHLPAADTGLLVIEKMEMDLGAWHEVVPYDGNSHSIFVPNDVYGPVTVDYLTMIVDRSTNTVNFILEDDMEYLFNSVEELLGVDIPDSIGIAELRALLAENGVDVDELADALIDAIDALLADMEVPGEEDYSNSTYFDLERIRDVLTSLPDDGTITINGDLPVNVGMYEFYILSYSEYYKSTDGSAVLFIEPIYVVVNDDDGLWKTYGETDPELTATVSYYSYVGRENPFHYSEDNTGYIVGGKFEQYNTESDETYGDIVYKAVEITELPGDSGLTYDVVRAEGEAVGTYAMSVENASVASGNYVLDEVVEDDTVFTINPKAVTVTVADQTKTYGEADPELTYTVDGLVGEDTLNVTASRETGENVGEYAITATVAENSNYDVTIVENGAALTINPKAVTVTVADQTKTYGEADPELTYTVDGLVEGDALNVTVSRETGEDVGEYAITATVAENSNYDVTIVENGAALTITAKAVTVTVDGQTKTYGEADPDLTYTVDGLVGEDTLTVTASRETGENVGEYAITATVAENKNYTVEVVPGTLTINPKAVTVTVDSQTKTYGEADPDLTYTVDGLVGEDTLNVTASRETGENVGEYAITATVEENPNYDVTIVENGAALTITKKAVTITVADQTVTYGDALSENGYTVEGDEQITENLEFTYIYKDSEGNVVETPEAVGVYTITAVSANSNYTVTVNLGTLTIEPVAEPEPDYVCWNMQTGVYYYDVTDALMAALGTTATIQMLKDYVETDPVIVYPNQSLDLNGMVLEAEYVVGIKGSYVYDLQASTGTGMIVMPKDNLVLGEQAYKPKSYTYLPAYDNETGAYKFTRINITDSSSTTGLTVDNESDTASYVFVVFDRDNDDLLLNGCSDSAMKVVVRIDWTEEYANPYQYYEYNDEMIAEVIKANGTRGFRLTLNNISALEGLTLQAVVITDSGAMVAGKIYQVN